MRDGSSDVCSSDLLPNSRPEMQRQGCACRGISHLLLTCESHAILTRRNMDVQEREQRCRYQSLFSNISMPHFRAMSAWWGPAFPPASRRSAPGAAYRSMTMTTFLSGIGAEEAPQPV